MTLIYVLDFKMALSVSLAESIWVKCTVAKQEIYFLFSLLYQKGESYMATYCPRTRLLSCQSSINFSKKENVTTHSKEKKVKDRFLLYHLKHDMNN